MPSPDDYLPIRETKTAADPQAVVEAIQECHDADLAVYPIGGGTSLGYGVPPSKEGVALSLAPLDRVLDYRQRILPLAVDGL